MRLSIVALLCLLIVVVHSATTTRRTVGTSKAPARKSAYTYLRSVRGKQSCASGTCPFWDKHGRSFAALRCYRREYQDCACLHRMCFSSCMFKKEVCNEEMVSCLQQICPRCMPASASAMCGIYDSMAERIAEALSAFACYPCCPMLLGSSSNNSAPANGVMTTTITNLPGNSMTTPPGSNVASGPMNTMITGAPSNVVVNSPPVGNNNGLAPGVGNNGNINVGSVNTPVLAPNNNVGNNPNNMGVNGGIIAGNAGVLANNNNVVPNRNQRVKQVARTTKRIVTTRRTPTTTRRTASAASTVHVNKVKNAARTSAQPSKKPQANRN